MKKTNRFLAFVCIFCFLLPMFCLSDAHAQVGLEDDVYMTGRCGDKMYFAVKDDTLYITGKGIMSDGISEDNQNVDPFWTEHAAKLSKITFPWVKFASKIKQIVLDKGVSELEWNVFGDLKYLEIVYLPSTIKIIYENNFDSANIKKVYFGGTEKQFRKIKMDPSQRFVLDKTEIVYKAPLPFVYKVDYKAILKNSPWNKKGNKWTYTISKGNLAKGWVKIDGYDLFFNKKGTWIPYSFPDPDKEDSTYNYDTALINNPPQKTESKIEPIYHPMAFDFESVEDKDRFPGEWVLYESQQDLEQGHVLTERTLLLGEDKRFKLNLVYRNNSKPGLVAEGSYTVTEDTLTLQTNEGMQYQIGYSLRRDSNRSVCIFDSNDISSPLVSLYMRKPAEMNREEVQFFIKNLEETAVPIKVVMKADPPNPNPGQKVNYYWTVDGKGAPYSTNIQESTISSYQQSTYHDDKWKEFYLSDFIQDLDFDIFNFDYKYVDAEADTTEIHLVIEDALGRIHLYHHIERYQRK